MAIDKEKLENLEIELETLDIALSAIYNRFRQCLSPKDLLEVLKLSITLTEHLAPDDITMMTFTLGLKALTENYLIKIKKEKTKDV